VQHSGVSLRCRQCPSTLTSRPLADDVGSSSGQEGCLSRPPQQCAHTGLTERAGAARGGCQHSCSLLHCHWHEGAYPIIIYEADYAEQHAEQQLCQTAWCSWSTMGTGLRHVRVARHYVCCILTCIQRQWPVRRPCGWGARSAIMRVGLPEWTTACCSVSATICRHVLCETPAPSAARFGGAPGLLVGEMAAAQTARRSMLSPAAAAVA
jgi:hypothetical protein